MQPTCAKESSFPSQKFHSLDRHSSASYEGPAKAAHICPETIIFHAVSPAVPEAATRRVRSFARRLGWQLVIIDAGEFADQDYLDNPVNRCFYRKRNLYCLIAAKTSLPIVS